MRSGDQIKFDLHIMADVSRWIQAALAEAKKGQEEGGLPIGSVMIDPETNRIVSTGHNLR